METLVELGRSLDSPGRLFVAFWEDRAKGYGVAVEGEVGSYEVQNGDGGLIDCLMYFRALSILS